MEKMELFKRYLKERIPFLIVFLLSCVIFAAVFFLYHIPPGAVVYPAVLSILIIMTGMCRDFVRVRKKHRKLSAIRGISDTMVTEFPEEKTIADSDYQQIIASILEDAAEIERKRECADREMVEYYTVWVHQIKTPISAMKLMLQNEDTREARRLSSELLRIEQYVEMVLAYLRLDSGSGDYVFKEYDLDEIIRKEIRRFASEFIGRKLRLEYEPVKVKIVTDEKWLALVIGQILSNALKYTKEGGVKIYLKEPLLLCIEDTGIGIAPSDLPRIFEKGYTGYNGRMNAASSGIGLYLCRRILKNLGAGIRVESEPDRGTAVLIDLAQYPLRTE